MNSIHAIKHFPENESAKLLMSYCGMREIAFASDIIDEITCKTCLRKILAHDKAIHDRYKIVQQRLIFLQLNNIS